MGVPPPSPSDYSHWSPLGDGESYAGPELREWQNRALEAWEASNHRGVVEAVTGAGKSLVGVAAIHEVLSLGGVALVMVPTPEERGNLATPGRSRSYEAARQEAGTLPNRRRSRAEAHCS